MNFEVKMMIGDKTRVFHTRANDAEEAQENVIEHCEDCDIVTGEIISVRRADFNREA